jgi:hypothetical protein
MTWSESQPNDYFLVPGLVLASGNLCVLILQCLQFQASKTFGFRLAHEDGRPGLGRIQIVTNIGILGAALCSTVYCALTATLPVSYVSQLFCIIFIEIAHADLMLCWMYMVYMMTELSNFQFGGNSQSKKIKMTRLRVIFGVVLVIYCLVTCVAMVVAVVRDRRFYIAVRFAVSAVVLLCSAVCLETQKRSLLIQMVNADTRGLQKRVIQLQVVALVAILALVFLTARYLSDSNRKTFNSVNHIEKDQLVGNICGFGVSLFVNVAATFIFWVPLKTNPSQRSSFLGISMLFLVY